jgi:hypothetical protein
MCFSFAGWAVSGLRAQHHEAEAHVSSPASLGRPGVARLTGVPAVAVSAIPTKTPEDLAALRPRP